MKKIFRHLDLWDVKRKPPPFANQPEADLKPLLSMIISQRPVRMIRLRYCSFGAMRFLIDADKQLTVFDSSELEKQLPILYP